ncbi:MAG: tetratricopeptide repeat protein [Candidatus Obscuribacterales bacterium]
MLSEMIYKFLRFLENQGKYRLAVRLGERYLTMNGVLPRGKPDATLFDIQILRAIDRCLMYTGNPGRALELAELTMSIVKEQGNSLLLASVGDSLASRKLLLGSLQEAHDLNQRVMIITENALGRAIESKASPQLIRAYKATLSSIYHLQSWIMETCRRYDIAETAARKAVKLSEDLFDDPIKKSFNQSLLVRILLHTDQIREAEPLARAIFEARQEKLPETHIHAFSSRQNLGRLLMRKHEYKEAEKYMLKAYNFALELSRNEGFTDMGSFETDLGELRLRQQRYEEAIVHLENALEKLKSSYCEEHPVMIDTLDHLAEANRKLGREDQARAIDERCRKIQAKIPELP